MSKKTIIGFVGAATVAVILLISALSSNSTAGMPFGILDQTGCCKRCPACDHFCKFDAKEGEIEKPGFEVESKVICIPRVVFPWQTRKACGSCGSCDGTGCSNCVNNGACTKRVCVLKSKDFKCPECEYSWSAEAKPDGGCATGCASACDASSDCIGSQLGAVPPSKPPVAYDGYSHPYTSGMESVTTESEPSVETLPSPIR